MDRTDVIENLNDLIQITEDSRDGYQRASEDGKDADLFALFSELARQRAAMVDGLQAEVRRLGGEPKDSGTLLAGAHRFYLDVVSAVAANHREIVLKEVERGETEAVRRFESVLAQPLPPETAAVVRQLLDRFRVDRSRMTLLKQAS